MNWKNAERSKLRQIITRQITNSRLTSLIFRLRALLDAEEQQYVIEIDAQQETVLERKAKMRARAKALREKREQERLAYVEEKLDIRWREECDELRPILARKHQNEVFEERAKQIEISNMIKSREKEGEFNSSQYFRN